MHAPEGSSPQASLPFPSARCAEWVASGSLPPPGPCSHRLPSKAQSGGPLSAQVSWPAPVHLMPDAGKEGPALPVRFTHHVVRLDSAKGAGRGKVLCVAPQPGFPNTKLCGSDSENTAACSLASKCLPLSHVVHKMVQEQRQF